MSKIKIYEAGEQLNRIANALEEVLRLVKQDQEDAKKRMLAAADEGLKEHEEKDSEQTTRASNGPSLPAALALVRGSGTKLQATSGKLQAPSRKLDKIKL